MKTFCRISLLIVAAFLCFGAGACSIVLYNEWFYPNAQKDSADKPFVPYEMEVKEPLQTQSSQEIYNAVSTGQDPLITCNTLFLVKEYQISSQITQEEEQALPAKYLGMNRDAFTESISAFELSPPLSELEKGFVSIDILSFSEEQVVIQKNYDSPEQKEGYYLVAEDNFVTAYCFDMKSVFLYTEIPMDSLPQNVQDEIVKVKYIESEAKLYDFLESYSS